MSARFYSSSEMLEVAEALQGSPAASSRDTIGADARCLIPTAVDMLRQAAGILTRIEQAPRMLEKEANRIDSEYGLRLDTFSGEYVIDYIEKGTK